MYKKFKKWAEFYIVYIREAHPIDGWRSRRNDRDGIRVRQPKTYEERCKVASKCVKELDLSIPALVDDMEDTAEKAYSGWPDRLFVVGKDGKLLYAGKRGPRGFKPGEVEEVLEGLEPDERKEEEKPKGKDKSKKKAKERGEN